MVLLLGLFVYRTPVLRLIWDLFPVIGRFQNNINTTKVWKALKIEVFKYRRWAVIRLKQTLIKLDYQSNWVLVSIVIVC